MSPLLSVNVKISWSLFSHAHPVLFARPVALAVPPWWGTVKGSANAVPSW